MILWQLIAFGFGFAWGWWGRWVWIRWLRRRTLKRLNNGLAFDANYPDIGAFSSTLVEKEEE